MKTIFIINDNSPEAKHAAGFALLIAQKTEANIMLANNFAKVQKFAEKVLEDGEDDDDNAQNAEQGLFEYLTSLNEVADKYKPEIEEIDISAMDEMQLTWIINHNHAWMMVKGMPHAFHEEATKHHINIHAVLNRVLCPLLMIPSDWQIKDVERVVYIADLRYCRIHVLRHLAAFASAWNADLSIAHLSAKGLPHMVEKYALTVFSEEVSPNVNYDRLFFNNIKERDLSRAVDVLVNGMHNDMLVMVNHRFHFEEIVGRYITDELPLHITVPLLIFPY